MTVIMKINGYFRVEVDTHDPAEARAEALRQYDSADFGPLFNVEGDFLCLEDR